MYNICNIYICHIHIIYDVICCFSLGKVFETFTEVSVQQRHSACGSGAGDLPGLQAMAGKPRPLLCASAKDINDM